MTGRTSISGFILQDYSKVYDVNDFEAVSNAMDKMSEKYGIYVLYDNEKLYYVGKSIDLKKRVKNHLKNQHAGKWNKFRIFLIKKQEILDDLETILITVSMPKGNGNRGIFPQLGRLDKKINNEIQKSLKLSTKGNNKKN